MGTETKRTKSRNINTESPNLTRETLGNVIKGQERRSRGSKIWVGILLPNPRGGNGNPL